MTHPAPMATASANAVHGVRIADHGAWTRLVVDMGAKTALPVAIAKDGKTLVIAMDGMTWQGKTGTIKDNSAMIGGYHYTGGQLNVTLRHPATIVTNHILAPYGKAGWRTVIDLAPAAH
jgi:hypothetical protein